MPTYHGHELALDDLDHQLEEGGVAVLVLVQPGHQVTPGMHDDVTDKRDPLHHVVGLLAQLQRALVLELLDDVLLHLLDGPAGVDEGEGEVLLERLQRRVVVAEDLVPLPPRVLVHVRISLLEKREPLLHHLSVLVLNGLAPLQLPLDALHLLNEEDGHAEHRPCECSAEWGVEELLPQ